MNPDANVWTGAVRVETSGSFGEWLWTDGTSQILDWYPGEPNGLGDANINRYGYLEAQYVLAIRANQCSR